MHQASLPCPIDPVRLNSLLGEAHRHFTVETLRECSSTSTLLLERAENAAPSGSVLIADEQTAGRGRRGRSWVSSAQAGLTFSLLWRFASDMSRLAGLSLAVGVAVARALAVGGVAGVGLKWPNDVLLDGGKLGGILVELESDPAGVAAVIGIGINRQLPPGDPAEFLHRPAALAQALSPLPDREQLLAWLLLELEDILDRFSQGGFRVLRDEWQARHAWQGRQVRLLNAGLTDREGVCLGADDDGALLLRTSTGIERCLSGDLSLRAA